MQFSLKWFAVFATELIIEYKIIQLIVKELDKEYELVKERGLSLENSRNSLAVWRRMRYPCGYILLL